MWPWLENSQVGDAHFELTTDVSSIGVLARRSLDGRLSGRIEQRISNGRAQSEAEPPLARSVICRLTGRWKNEVSYFFKRCKRPAGKSRMRRTP